MHLWSNNPDLINNKMEDIKVVFHKNKDFSRRSTTFTSYDFKDLTVWHKRSCHGFIYEITMDMIYSL